MPTELPTHRFNEFADLDTDEISRWKALAETRFPVPRNGILRREGEVPTAIFFLIDGWFSSSMTLAGGERQILKVHLAGDVMGTPSMGFSGATETLTAVTPSVVSKVSLQRVGELFDASPRLATLFMLSVQRERVALMDRLISIGRTSALARVAALLLDFRERLVPLGRVQGNRFELPLIQEHLGDLLGLTAVHVNRTLRELEERSLIVRERQTVGILNLDGLERLSGRTRRRLVEEPAWLPAARPPVES